MARKKIWAYACNTDGTYIWNDIKGKERLYFIWEVIKLRRDDPKTFSSLTFMSTQSDKNKRAELTAVKKSKSAFFRYKSEPIFSSESDDKDYDLMSHETAILVLSEMDVIKFKYNDTLYEIEFDKIKKDDLKIRFEDGAIYYPDLMGFFSKPLDLAKKWGGKVAIEVKVTHKCSYEKIKDFHDHNIPIIEVSLSDKMRLPSEVNNADVNEHEMEKYYRFLQGRFAEVVFMKVLSDPTMPAEHKIIQSSLERKNIELENSILIHKEESEKHIQENKAQRLKLNSIEETLPRIKKLINDKQNEIDLSKEEIKTGKNEISSLNKEIEALKKVSYDRLTFLQKIRRLF